MKHFRKIRKKHHFILILAFVVAFALIAMSLAIKFAPESQAIADWGWPPHSHDGYPLQATYSYTYTYTEHLQEELNYISDNDPNLSLTHLGPTGIGSYGPNTKGVVEAYQSARGLTVDGIVGNEVWSQMEFDVFQTFPTYRHPDGVGFKYPIYSSCRKITNNTGSDLFVPIETSAEWSAFRNNLPSGVTDAAADCTPSAGGGGGGGGGGGWTESSCNNIHPSCCPAECTSSWCTGLAC